MVIMTIKTFWQQLTDTTHPENYENIPHQYTSTITHKTTTVSSTPQGQNQPRQEIMSHIQYPAYHAVPHITEKQDSHLEQQTECEKETSQRRTWAKKGKSKEENLKSAISGTGKKPRTFCKSATSNTGSESRLTSGSSPNRTVNWNEGALLSNTWDAVLKKLTDSRV